MLPASQRYKLCAPALPVFDLICYLSFVRPLSFDVANRVSSHETRGKKIGSWLRSRQRRGNIRQLGLPMQKRSMLVA